MILFFVILNHPTVILNLILHTFIFYFIGVQASKLGTGSPRGLATYTVRRLRVKPAMTKEGHQRELVPKSILLPNYYASSR